MNRVEISGGITRDPELRYTPSGAPVLNMSVAVNGARYDGQKREQVVTTEYIAVEIWGSYAEEVAEMAIPKGSEVYVLGELTHTEREKRDGTKESKTRVKAMLVNVVRRRGGGSAPRADAPKIEMPPPMEPPPGYSDDEEPF